MKTSQDTFLDVFEKALDNGNAALFAGAGLSRASGFVDWKGLLRGIAHDLGLDVDQESDLVALAQYHVNSKGGRGALNQLLIDEFTKDAKATRNHELIARLPINTLWTTNYDTIIEEAFRNVHKRLDVKIQRDGLALHKPKRDAVLYKMHGDVSAPGEAVLTKEDYETYHDKRSLFSLALQGDLITKTFLFLGFSFTDPNIDHVLGRIRGLLGTNRRDHFCIMKEVVRPAKMVGKAKAEHEYEIRKLELRIQDLQRYGIQTVLVPDFGRITAMLEELTRRHYRKNIFVSGSAHDHAPLGQPRLERLARRIGGELINRGYNLTSGFGLGIGGAVVLGAIEEVYKQQNSHFDERTTLRPFPQHVPQTMSREQMQTRYREEMIADTGFTIFIAGNKLKNGVVVPADGCKEEFDIARKLQKYPIPIGATGHVARDIWTIVTASLDSFFPGKARKVESHFRVLGEVGRTDDELISAVFAIMDAVVTR